MLSIKGKIVFDPVNKTKKHIAQGSWKKSAMIMIDGDICEYYAWFLKKRFNITLNAPLRGAHITFINDKFDGRRRRWEAVKEKYEGQEMYLSLNVSPRTDDKHWWLVVDEKSREPLHAIREEIGLETRPFFGLHLSLGFANEKNIEHSTYIHRLIKKKLI